MLPRITIRFNHLPCLQHFELPLKDHIFNRIGINGCTAGWKCSVPQKNGLVILAPILPKIASFYDECAIIPNIRDGQAVALIEPEIAFILGEDIEPNRYYTNNEIDHAISETHMALELIQHHFSDAQLASFCQKLADGLSNQGLLLGPEIDKSVAYQASHIDILVRQSLFVQQFVGTHPCDLPQNPMYWLVNYLAKLGIGLSAGQAIIAE
ncbi:hypothetical protein ACWXWU_13955 [Shewanella sp. A14]